MSEDSLIVPSEIPWADLKAKELGELLYCRLVSMGEMDFRGKGRRIARLPLSSIATRSALASLRALGSVSITNELNYLRSDLAGEAFPAIE